MEISPLKAEALLGVNEFQQYVEPIIAIPQGNRFALLINANRQGFGGPLKFVGENLPAWTQWCWWYNPNAATATCAIPLNALLKRPLNTADWPNNYAFASKHVGGGHFSMADGSTRFVSENVDINVYRAAATIGGGEIASDF